VADPNALVFRAENEITGPPGWRVRGRGSQTPGKNRREFLRRLIVKLPGLVLRIEQPLKRMKIGDRVYLMTGQLQTGAGIPAMICAIQDDSTVEVAVELTHGTRILKVTNCDILPSNLYTHSILNVVYQSYEEIEHERGSILSLNIEEIVQKLIQHGLAPESARRCVDLFDGVEWHHGHLPLRQWLRRIRDFYHQNP